MKEQRERVNLTDGDVQLMKGRHGILPACNAPAVVSRTGADGGQHQGMVITAVDVVDDPTDYGQLAPLLQEAEAMMGVRSGMVLADGGYHTGANLEACRERGQTLMVPAQERWRDQGAYFKDRFVYEKQADSYRCPEGKVLLFKRMAKTKNGTPIRVYRALKRDCHTCSAYGVCTKDKHSGRVLMVGPNDVRLREHRAWMRSEQARRLYDQRKGLIEPVFGIIKE